MNKIITAGLELEMTVPKPAVHSIAEANGFGFRTDASICDNFGRRLPKTGPGAGVELVTPIIETPCAVVNGGSCTFDFTAIDHAVDALCSTAARVNSTCGVHIHLGRPNGEETTWNPQRLFGVNGGKASEWKPGHIKAWLAVAMNLENRIFDCVPVSRRQSRHCRGIRQTYSSDDLMAYTPLRGLVSRKHDNPQRYCWLNLIETSRPADPNETRIGYARSTPFGTVEIRALGETQDADYVKAWAHLWIKIAAVIAYTPAESAILRCCYTDWLQPDFDALAAIRKKHEEQVAPLVRSVMPVTTVNED